jgi:malate/lactate dehydrogenase
MYPDVRNCTINGKSALSLIDADWKIKEFTPRV